MRFSRYWAKAGALLIALAVTGVIPATGSASGSNTGPHSSDIEVSKKAVKAETVGATTTITWKVVVTNDGGRDLEQVLLHDDGVNFGPPASSFDDHCTTKPEKGDKSDHDHNNVSPCVDDPALLQEHERLTYIGTQTMDKACGWIKNTVKVTAEDMISGRVYGRQKPTLEASATAKIFLQCADFDVTKVAKAPSYNQGDTIEWIVTVTNTGNVPLSNPVLTDPGVSFGPPSSNMPAGSARHAKSVRKAKSSSGCEKKSSSKSPTSVKDECKDNDDPKCEDDDKGHSAKSVSKDDDDCAKDDGVLRPGETLTFIGTQTATTCGVVSNTVTVTVTSLPRKMHDDDEAEDGDAKHESSKAKAGNKKKVVVKRSKHKKDKPHTPPMPAVTLTDEATATTFVVCQVVVTKDANVTFTRTFDWTITKNVDSTTFNVTPAGSAIATYTVTATKSAPTDTGFKVAGSITVKNPYPTALPVTVTDQLASLQGTCTVADSVASVPANGMRSFSYSCDLGDARPTGMNTATAGFTVNNQSMSASGSAPVVVGNPTTLVNDSVTVTDTFQDVPSTLFGGSISQTMTATYTRPLTAPGAAPNCFAYTNVATILLANNVTKPTAPVVVNVCANAGVTPGTQVPPAVGVAGVPPVTLVGTPVPAPSLRVTKTGPATAIAGQLATYRITVTNRGTGEARGVVLRDVVPRGFSVFGTVRGATVSRGAVRWSIGTLAPGQSRTVRATFRIDRTMGGRSCNTAIATPSNGTVARARRCTRVIAVAGATRIPGVTG